MLYYGGKGQVLPIGVGVRCQVLPTFLASSSPLLMTWQLLPNLSHFFHLSSALLNCSHLSSPLSSSCLRSLFFNMSHFFSHWTNSSRLFSLVWTYSQLFPLVLCSFLFSHLFIFPHFSGCFSTPTSSQFRRLPVNLVSFLFISSRIFSFLSTLCRDKFTDGGKTPNHSKASKVTTAWNR